jgi:UPF0042 nucleotide-binding protein
MKGREGPEPKSPEPARAPQDPRVVILTGVSGSGKSTALRALEDSGFYCVDNLPIVFLEKLLELSGHTAGEVTRIALVVDAREGRFLAEAPRVIDEVRRSGTRVDVIYFDATDEALLRRFSETRRRHPLSEGSVPEGIAAERKALERLKAIANEVVDTTTLNVHELKRLVHARFVEGAVEKMGVTVISFGFRYGLPAHADLVLDVRFLPNPFFVPTLSALSGEDDAVARFVLDDAETGPFVDKAEELIALSVRGFQREGKSYATVAIGCTGGRHRSVAIAKELGRRLGGRFSVSVRHRDIQRGGAP